MYLNVGGVEVVHHARDQRVCGPDGGNYVWIRWTTDGRILERDLGKSRVKIDGQEKEREKSFT